MHLLYAWCCSRWWAYSGEQVALVPWPLECGLGETSLKHLVTLEKCKDGRVQVVGTQRPAQDTSHSVTKKIHPGRCYWSFQQEKGSPWNHGSMKLVDCLPPHCKLHKSKGGIGFIYFCNIFGTKHRTWHIKGTQSVSVSEWMQVWMEVIDVQKKYSMSLHSPYHDNKQWISWGKKEGNE